METETIEKPAAGAAETGTGATVAAEKEHELITEARTGRLMLSMDPEEFVRLRMLGAVRYHAFNPWDTAAKTLAVIRGYFDAEEAAVAVLKERHAAAKGGGL